MNAKASAAAQVAASVKKTDRLRVEAAAYKELAASAAAGSAEQVAASNLAARAQVRLAGSMGVSSVEAVRLRGHAGGLERDIGRASRGALAGSGVFRAFGRSLAFASGGFLLFASAGEFVRKSIDAARAATVTQKQLAAQFRASGLSLGVYQKQIDQTNLRLSALAGINKDQLDASFTTIFRGAGNVTKALKDEQIAADIAAGRHISLAAASIAVGKAAAGSTTALRRLGIELPKGTSGAEALALAQRKFAGQAAAGATEAQKFGAVLHDSEVIIGEGLLPTLNQYLAKGATWLSQMNESGRLQKDVAKASHDVGEAVHVAGDAFKAAAAVIGTVDRATGGLENTLKDLAAVWLLLKARTALIGWGVISGGIAEVGSAAAGATTQAERLEATLGRLKLIGPIAIAIGLTEFISFAQKQAKHIAAQNGPNFTLKGSSNQFSLGGRGGVFGTGTSMFAPGVAGSPLNPFAPNRFSGDLGVGALKGQNSVAKAFAAAAAAATARTRSPLGQFNIDELRLANAERTKNTKLQRQILVSELAITTKLQEQAKTLKDRTKYAQQAAALESSITSIDQQAASTAAQAAAKRKAAADKAKAAAAKAALGGVPLSLQLAQAKADAIAAGSDAQSLTKGQMAAAHAIKNAEQKAIRSHKLSMQGLIDAWNEIASINQTLAAQSTKGTIGTYHRASTKALTEGLRLTRDQAVAIRDRAAQMAAHRGFVPSDPAVLGQTVFTGDIHLHGVQNVDQLAAALAKKARHQHQRRGTRR